MGQLGVATKLELAPRLASCRTLPEPEEEKLEYITPVGPSESVLMVPKRLLARKRTIATSNNCRAVRRFDYTQADQHRTISTYPH